MVKALASWPAVFLRTPIAAAALSVVFLTACLRSAHAAAPETPMAPPEPLVPSIAPLIAAVERDGIAVGLRFEDFAGNRIFGYHDETPLVLASNTKLFTTAAALLALPEDFRWSTSARLADDALWIVGAGDATFHLIGGYSYPDKFLDEAAAALKRLGVRQVAQLVVDGRYFDGEIRHPMWPQDQLRQTYAAAVVGLPYARGVVRTKSGSRRVDAASSSPLQVFAKFARNGLKARGIHVAATRIVEGAEPAPDPCTTIYRQVSPLSLADVIHQTNVGSDNFYAEHLLKTLGAELGGGGSFAEGLLCVRRTLEPLGIPLEGYAQVDGSGLARSGGGGNVASPITIVALLRAMAQHPRGMPFVHSLAVAGVSGTLANRFDEPPLKGRVLAKTGTINGSLTLSGYLATEDQPVAAFSILANYRGENTYARRQRIRQFQGAVLRLAWDYLRDADRRLVTQPALVSADEANNNGAAPVE